jgi:hypothetical protein
LPRIAAKKRWFFSYEGEVFGPLRLSEIQKKGEPGASLLCCFDGKSGWVAIGDLLDLGEAAVPLLGAAELPAPLPALPEFRKSRGPLEIARERGETALREDAPAKPRSEPVSEALPALPSQ